MQIHLTTTAIYASLLTLLLLTLAYRVILLRRKLLVGIGDGHKIELRRAIAAHQNAVENIPIMLFLMAIYEFNQGSDFWLQAFAALFTIGRLLNAWGVSRINNNSPGRFYGMVMSVVAMISLAIFNLTRLL
jgi:uncharacterized protein